MLVTYTVRFDRSLVLSCLKRLNVSIFWTTIRRYCAQQLVKDGGFEEQYEWPRLIKFIISHKMYSDKSCEVTGKDRYAISR